MDPSSEYHYTRSFYQLHEGDKLIPVDYTPFNDMPMVGNGTYGDTELLDEMKFLANHMKIFGGKINASNPMDGLSDPWAEYAQDMNFTDDYLEEYLEKYLDDADLADYIDDKYFDDKYFESLNNVEEYDDDVYGDYFEDGQLISQNEDEEFVDVLDPINYWEVELNDNND